ncbi:hypothetical protein LIER_12019 [Lithospermum erythrorhizon]|uniref:Non-specific lipid-transfer protein n=1 Tax=Lithospermum erythrorhizon TaxID=34254 RepID=A0AAV3PQ59_LITER
MAMSSKINASLFLFFCMVVLVQNSEAISCGQVQSNLISCFNYLRNGGPIPLNCCIGVRSLNAAATTTADRQTVCRCALSIVKAIPGISNANLSALPGKCRVNLPYKISTSINCNKLVPTSDFIVPQI